MTSGLDVSAGLASPAALALSKLKAVRPVESIKGPRESGMSPDKSRAKSEDLRRGRLAASLRENLKRRKAQSRAREVEAQPSNGPTAPPSGEPDG
jgi:hypothetical protein